MGLWSNLFRHAARDEGALLAPGRTFPPAAPPAFPDLGRSLRVSDGADLPLDAIVGAGKPAVVLIYSNC